jgi:2-oxoglutarate ferredoxin oxidoreductase subunit beta
MIEYLRSHAMLVQKYERLIAEGKPIPEGTFTIGELVRRNRPAMGVQP